MNGNRILKIFIFTLLSVLCVALLLIYVQSGYIIFSALGCITFLALFAAIFFEFETSIKAALDRLKRNLYVKKKEPKKEETHDVNSWEKFVENSPIPCIIFDLDLNIVRNNRAFINLLQTNALNISAKKIEDVFACNLDELKEAMAKNNYTESVAGSAILKNQLRTPFTFFSAPINPDKDSDKVFFAQFVDNSEKEQLKEKFIQAQKMQAIGQLAGGIAHDFNNLLTAIGGFSDLLLARHAPGDSSFVDIMHIKQNANRAANLVRQLLAFSRKQTMQMEVLRLDDVLAEISNLTRRLIGENITLEVNIDRDLWDIKADKSQLDQVLINLAVNARDAMHSGGKLTISCHNADILTLRDIKFKFPNSGGSGDIVAGKYVVISIADTGCGVPTENIKKIFEPFFTTKEVGQGTGLGLATVTGIVEQLGGAIFVSSAQDAGTEFLIYLKRHERTAAENQPTEQKKEKAKDLTGSGTILIVEDEEAVRMFSTRALKNKGYKVIEAFSGENALDVIEEFGGDNIDLIISDVVMPGLSGPEFVEQISPKYPDIKVIFVSGYGEDAFYQKYGMERKFNFLSKPYSLNQLAERVKELLS